MNRWNAFWVGEVLFTMSNPEIMRGKKRIFSDRESNQGSSDLILVVSVAERYVHFFKNYSVIVYYITRHLT